MRTWIAFLAIMTSGIIQSQESPIVLTFTSIDTIAHTQVDRIRINNRTRYCDTILYWPDTVLVLGESSGIDHLNPGMTGFHVYQNYPNPVISITTIQIYIPERDNVTFIISDISGRTLYTTLLLLEAGMNELVLTPGDEKVYLFTAFFQGRKSSIRILNTSSGEKELDLNFMDWKNSPPGSKSLKDLQYFRYKSGDTLRFIAYRGEQQSGITDHLDTSKLYTFQFASGIPCPGIPTVNYEDQVYNTVQIFSQCWFKENLNVGVKVSSIQGQSNNGVIEKYCYWNHTDSCDKYGGLYTWNEMRNWKDSEGTQGICPDGWHIPSDEEWKILEGAVDSIYGIVHPEWDISYTPRGYDVAKNIKTTLGWKPPRNGSDKFGFSALPGGFSSIDEVHQVYFFGVGEEAAWWSSSNCIVRRIDEFHYDQISRYPTHYLTGKSVRCIRD